ncbi:MAG: hypothetical protein AAB634_02905 [Patescibacteria group bacterium]
MKKILKKPEIISGMAAIALYFAAGIVLFVHLGRLPDQDLIIRFNSAEGIKALGGRMDFVMLFITSGAIAGINFFLARELFFKERVLSMLLLWGSGLLALFTLIAMGLIVSIN